ncbi:MAG: hypothetical protein C0412_06845 [Flavobacterium sp.]|nr:hypothetical protein [Flavobacterium sp.]
MLLLTATGCTTVRKEFIPLPEERKAQIKSTEMNIIYHEEKLSAQVEPSRIAQRPGCGGLLFALIDCAVESNRGTTADKCLSPINATLVGFNQNELMKEKVINVINKADWLKIKNINVINNKYHVVRDELLNKEMEDVTGILSSNFVFKHDFSALNVVFEIELYSLTPEQKQKKDKDSIEPIYRAKVATEKILKGATKSYKDNSALWSADGGTAIKTAINEAINEVSVALESELNDTNKSYLVSKN